MISLLFRRSPRKSTIDALYGMIVAQARSPSFYRSYGVPDTVDARLDMILLHLVLLLRQLAANGAQASVGQPLFDRFCRDIDNNFREMGVGDLKVPKEMRRVAEAFYGRAKAYEQALPAGGQALAMTVARNVYGLSEPSLGAHRLAAYMEAVATRLARQDAAGLERAVEFPDPDVIAAPQPGLQP